MLLNLTPDEIEILLKLLKTEISAVGPELRHTQSSTFHDELKAYKHLLQDLARRLESGGDKPAAQ